jgi:hypothetical protein
LACSEKKEFVAIAYGRSEDTSLPKMAFEIYPNGNCYYVTGSHDEISSYYSSKIPVHLAEVITDFVKIRMDSTYSLRLLQARDATIAEYRAYRDNETLGRFRYLVQGKDSDSIGLFINSIRKSPDFKSIPFHTNIQNQTLPKPPQFLLNKVLLNISMS